MLLHLKITPRHPPVTVHDLALMLEIDLIVMNDKKTFERRLNTAVLDAYRQGQRKRQTLIKTKYSAHQ